MEKTILANCKNCHKTIFVRISKVKESGNCCSRKCFCVTRKSGLSVTKYCEVCGNLFKVIPCRQSAKYCGRKCAGLAKRVAMKHCIICLKKFKPRRPKSQYCSATCRIEGSKNSFNTACKWCGITMQKPVCKKQQKNIFCCWDHANKWSKRNQIILCCKVCGSSFAVSRSGAKNRMCCSFACREKSVINGFEQKVYELLDSLQIVYLPQHLVHNKFVVDAYVPSINLIIQFDGDYWHGNHVYFPEPNKIQQKNIRRDKSMDSYMTKCGYSILRFWESDFNLNKQMIIENIKEQLNTV